MSSADDQSSVPLLSPTLSITSSSATTTTGAHPNDPPATEQVATESSTNQETPGNDTSENTRVLVRKLSRKNSQKNIFTVTKVTNTSNGLVTGTKCLPTFAEEPTETEGASPPAVTSHFQPPLKRNAGPSQKHPYFHSGGRRGRLSVEFLPDELLRRQSDRSSSIDGTLKSLTKASQSDISEIYKSGTGPISREQLREVAKRGRLFAKRKTFRLVHQSGECNIQYVNVDKRGARFLLDIFTTLVALPWRYNILVYLVSFLLSWMLFALVWWGFHILYRLDDDGTPCVEGVVDFTSAFLFSIETQHTIGYGSRHITTRCSPAVCLLILQSVFGAVMQCVVTGIVFAKLSRPNQRAETVMFSRKAVICLDQDGALCLVFRVGDMRRSQLIGVSINTVLVRKVLNSERRTIQLEQECLRTTTEANRHHDEDLAGFYFLAWPIKIIHRIDEHSPLYNLSPNDLLVANFEIVVVLEATCEATGATIQVRTSYLPSEILWGHSLVSLVTYQKDNGRFKVDYSQFDEVKPVYTPEKSACVISKDKSRFRGGGAASSVEILDETKKNYHCVKSKYYSGNSILNDDNNNPDNEEKPVTLLEQV